MQTLSTLDRKSTMPVSSTNDNNCSNAQVFSRYCPNASNGAGGQHGSDGIHFIKKMRPSAGLLEIFAISKLFILKRLWNCKCSGQFVGYGSHVLVRVCEQ